MMKDTLLGSDIRWVYCLPCRRAFELEDGRGACRCGRSRAALFDDGILQVQGPAKALTPLETVVHLDGGEWTLVPEDVTVRRILPAA